MEFLRNFLSSIIILLAIPLLLIGSISFIARQTVLSENFVERQTEENNLYEGLAEFTAASLKDQANDESLEPVIDRAVSVERVRNAVEPALNSLFAFLKARTDEGSIVVDFRPIKNDIKRSAPQLNQEELDELIPDELRAEATERQTSRQPSGLENIKTWYRRLNQWSYFLPFFVLALLVLLALVNHGRSRIRRPAYVLLIVGLIMGLAGGIATIGIPYALRRLGGNPDFPAVANSAIDSLARNVGGEVSRWILVFGVGYLILAVVLFVVSFFIHQPIKVGGDERVYDPRRGTVRR